MHRKLRRGDIILVHGKGLIGKIIRVFTDSYYSHAGVYVGKIYGINSILEADWRGVFIENLSKYDNTPYAVYRYKKKTSHISKIKKGMKEIGRYYDFKQFVGFAISLLFHKKYNLFNSPDKYICSELINKMYDYKIGRKGLTSPQIIAENKLFKLVFEKKKRGK